VDDTYQHTKWQKKMLGNVPVDSQFLLVSKKSKVIVTAPSGQKVWFHPVWNTVDDRFETVSIESQDHHDIYLDLMDDAGNRAITKEKYVTMTAHICTGELVSKTVKNLM